MKNEFYTRIPDWVFDDLRDAKINSKMFLVLVWLFKRANWRTGVVKNVSAKYIQRDMWADETEDSRLSLRTIQEYLFRFRRCGYLKSNHVQGQRQTYTITLNNYIAVITDEDGAVTEKVLRPTETLDWRELPRCRCADKESCHCGDASGDASGEASGDASGEASATTTLSPHSDNTLTTTSQHPHEQESQSDSEQAATPPTPGHSASPLPPSAGRAGADAPQPTAAPPEEPQVHVDVMGMADYANVEDVEAAQLFYALSPVVPNDLQALADGIARCRKILYQLDLVGVDADNLLDYNRSHKPANLRIRTLSRLEKAIKGKDGECALLNDYLTHPFTTCKICRDANVLPNFQILKAKREALALAAARRREAALRADLTERFTAMLKIEQCGLTKPDQYKRRDFVVLGEVKGKAIIRVSDCADWHDSGETDKLEGEYRVDRIVDHFMKSKNLTLLREKLGWGVGSAFSEEDVA